MGSYFDLIDAATQRCKSAKTPDEVLDALGRETEYAYREAFYGGDGDDLLGALHDAGWSSHRYAASYYWVVKAPNGELLSYTEGDIHRGDNPQCDQ